MERDRAARGWARQRTSSHAAAIMHSPFSCAVAGATGTPPSSPDAAVMSAAHDVIRTLHPESAVEAALTAGLATFSLVSQRCKASAAGE
jgi:hypothetical protein